ncbi:hypothetical protein RNJ44_04178 [Nakaseomyces bracarensis]|uniref:CS domain-containing protein n=1 Tax=Nakaseomyces bracarensis TaxID=273131 RepID=A0ABR4NUE6_9SACH
MSKVLTPEVAWAQRSSETDAEKNYLLITVSIPDCESPKVTIDANTLDLEAISKGHVGDEAQHTYKLHIDLYKEIDAEKSLHKVANGQHYFLKLFKKDLGIEYWPRLTKEKVKYNNIKTDFDKWVDEDEQEEVGADAGMPGDMDFSQMMGGAGGPGGPGGMPGMPGGMPGGMDFSQMMGGAGGAGGMDLSALMGGAGGAGGPSMEQLQSMLAAQGGLDGAEFGEEEEGEEEGEEEVEEIK